MNDCMKFHQLYDRLNEIAKQFHQMYKPEYKLSKISIDADRGLFYFYLDYLRIGLPIKLLDKDDHQIYRYLFDKMVSLYENEPQ